MVETIAAAATVTFRSIMGNKRVVAGVWSPSDYYATDGDSLTPAMLGMKTIEQLIIVPNGGFIPEWVKATDKVKVESQEPTNATSGTILLTQVASHGDPHALSFPFVAFGY